MCGLIGSVNLPLPPEAIAALRHRGPDGEGRDDLMVGSHAVSLGHRRLAIVDLSPAGHQPMSSGAGGVIAFNGEIYNHAVLRARLGPGLAWRGRSDTETLLAWLETHDVDGIPDLNGIFSFAWLDRRRRRLVLARDSFGVKPLYYAIAGNRLVFGSELSPLRSLLADEVDPESIALLLRLRYLPAPHTLYRRLSKLHPGHVLIVDLSEADLRVDVRPVDMPAPPVPLSLGFAEATAEYQRLLRQAVERQLMADTEVGILLSGGVDSALVARFARDATPGRLQAFTVGFEGQYAENEIDDARLTADRLGIGFQSRVVTLDDFLGALRRVSRVVEEPLATTSIVPMDFLAGLAAEQVKVVLSGQGADEPLGGYARYQGYLLADLLPAPVAPAAVWLARQLGVRSEQVLRGLATAAVSDERERLLAAWQVFAPDEIAALTGIRSDRARAVLDYAWRSWPCAADAPPVARMMRLDLRLNLADDLLLYTDRVTMRHSLECRVPYLDSDLIRFLEALPLHYRLRLRGGKRIHREAAAAVLPPEILSRPKKGFQVPTLAWFRDTTRLRAVLAEHGRALWRYVDRDEVDKVLVQHAAGFNRERQIFLLLTLAFILGEDA